MSPISLFDTSYNTFGPQQYMIQDDLAPNLLSIYDPGQTGSSPIFQIDANLGYPAAVMVQKLP